MYVCMFVCMYVRMYVCTRVCMCVRVCSLVSMHSNQKKIAFENYSWTTLHNIDKYVHTYLVRH